MNVLILCSAAVFGTVGFAGHLLLVKNSHIRFFLRQVKKSTFM